MLLYLLTHSNENKILKTINIWSFFQLLFYHKVSAALNMLIMMCNKTLKSVCIWKRLTLILTGLQKDIFLEVILVSSFKVNIFSLFVQRLRALLQFPNAFQETCVCESKVTSVWETDQRTHSMPKQMIKLWEQDLHLSILVSRSIIRSLDVQR